MFSKRKKRKVTVFLIGGRTVKFKADRYDVSNPHYYRFTVCGKQVARFNVTKIAGFVFPR